MNFYRPRTFVEAIGATLMTTRNIWREYFDTARCRRQFKKHQRSLRRTLAGAKPKRHAPVVIKTVPPAYEEFRHPFFLVVTALAVLVLVVDTSDGWADLFRLAEFVADGSASALVAEALAKGR